MRRYFLAVTAELGHIIVHHVRRIGRTVCAVCVGYTDNGCHTSSASLGAGASSFQRTAIMPRFGVISIE